MGSQAVVLSQTLTPILDRVQPLPAVPGTSLKYSWKGLFIGVLAGAVLGGLLILGDNSSGPVHHIAAFLLALFGNTNPVLLLPVVFLANFAAIVVHETGHLIAGLCVGFHLDHMRVGWFLFRPPFRVSLQRNRLFGVPAHVSMIPPNTGNLRFKLFVFAIAGPLTNLVSGGLALGLQSATQKRMFGFYALISLILGVANLAPFTSRKGAASDGKRAWILLADREQGNRWVAITQLSTAIVAGLPPEQSDTQLVKQATSLVNDAPDTVAAYQLAYLIASHARRDEEAARYLETSLAHFKFASPVTREALPFQAAIFQARKRKNVALAQAWLNQAPAKTMVPGMRLQAEAAIREAENRVPEAIQKIDESIAAVVTIKEESLRKLSIRFLEKWKAELLAGDAALSKADAKKV